MTTAEPLFSLHQGCDYGKCLLNWYGTLDRDRGGRAALRRAEQPDDAYTILAFHQLLYLLEWPPAWKRPAMLARIAHVVAMIKEDTGNRPAAAKSDETGEGGHGDHETNTGKPQPGRALGQALAASWAVKPARLGLLTNTEDIEMFVRLLRGSLALLEYKAPVCDVADTIRCWHSTGSRQFARRNLLLSYFENVSPKLLEKNNA